MAVVEAIVADLSSRLVISFLETFKKELRVCFSSSEISEDFDRKKQLLCGMLDTMVTRVQTAEENDEAVQPTVVSWMNEANQLRQELNTLEASRIAGSSFPCCGNYRLTKRMYKKTKIMNDLIEGGNFQMVSHRDPLPRVGYVHSTRFMTFESREDAKASLTAAIVDDHINKVGLYGMGGSGKTTLIKAVGREVANSDQYQYERVVFTTISQTPDVWKIQGEIADALGLSLADVESENGRATRIASRLSRGHQRILIILDDMWSRLDLDTIGISNGCKIVITTREEQICTSMDCERRIHLQLLSQEESWTFFQVHAQIEFSRENINLARRIANECGRLPIAIEAVGITLRGKPDEEWEEALDRLKNARPMDMEEGVRDAFTCLKLSYDFLRNPVAKSLFLMCALFPEDHHISVEELFRIGIGLNLCQDPAGLLQNARRQLQIAINTLVRSSLLEHSEKGRDHLKMHDVVRDVSLWIAKSGQRAILTNPNDRALGEAYALSSWSTEGDQFPRLFHASNVLQVLLLHPRSSLDLSKTSFNGLTALKVFAIVNENSDDKMEVSFPRSLHSSLPNLQTVRLVGLKLGNISFIAKFHELEILDLRQSEFNELPPGIAQLKKLKLLDLTRCNAKKSFYKVLDGMALEEVYLLCHHPHAF